MYTIALILLKRAFALLLLFAFILMTLAFIIECYVLIHVGSREYQNSILFRVSCVWLSWLLNNIVSYIICNLTKWFRAKIFVKWLTRHDKTHFVILQYDFNVQAIYSIISKNEMVANTLHGSENLQIHFFLTSF